MVLSSKRQNSNLIKKQQDIVNQGNVSSKSTTKKQKISNAGPSSKENRSKEITKKTRDENSLIKKL